ncbi:MAG TPA: GC-type dockerin domain-anchored protein [Phycisphaerales bacterium]|nr:GC-type dockerin domain-anchored protein [Phycisphaerales bacterium]
MSRPARPSPPPAPVRLARIVAALATLFSAGAPARAQCPGRWVPGEGLPGLSGNVFTVASLPGGDTVAGGAFSVAGAASAPNIARWNPAAARWSAIGAGLNASVFATAVLPDGDLIVGGMFTHSGASPLGGVARLNPATNAWSPLGAGVTGGDVNALAVAPGGEVYVAGNFSTAGSLVVSGIARWSSTTGQWSALGQSPNRGFNAVAVHPGGDVYVGGNFGPNGFSALGVARWSPATSTWSTLGPGLAGGAVNALAILPGGDVVAGGQFLSVPGAPALSVPAIARWNPATSTWSALGAGITGQSRRVNALLTLPGGDFLAAGDFGSAGASPASNIARWTDSAGSWSPVAGGTNGPVTALASTPSGPSAGEVIVGGGFSLAAGTSASTPGVLPVANIAKLRPSPAIWSALGSAISGPVNAIAVLPAGPAGAAANGDLIVAGSFLRAGPIAASNVARWNPTHGEWASLGSGLNATASAAVALPTGDAIVGGQFTTAGGVAANRIARWNASASAWSALGPGITGPAVGARVLALAALPNGTIVAGGGFTNAGAALAIDIAMFDPTSSTWSAMGSGLDNLVYALAALPGGDAIAGGAFSASGSIQLSGIARWNATSRTWSPLGPGVNGTVYALTVVPSSSGTRVIVAGAFSTAGGVSANSIASWNADTGAWSPLGAFGGGVEPTISSVAAIPAFPADLVVGGTFLSASGVPAQRVARWNSTARTWSPLGSGATGGSVNAVAAILRGDILIGGGFTSAGGTPASSFARWTTQPVCPGDFDCSGIVGIDDLFAYLNAYLAASPAADANGLDGLTIDDLFHFISIWFSPC